ncbi:MAG TPA: hypothetical protein ENN81_12970 [Phycisphaerales bacterium]|nr:hypothetical protein [Phycisphaerales bacterium]
MNPADDITDAIRRMHVTTRPQTDRRILNEAFAALDAAVAGDGGLSVSGPSRIFTLRFGHIAAAAVLIVGLGLLIMTTGSRPIAVQEVLRAVEQAPNLRIARYTPDDMTQPAQSVWVSRDRKLKLYDTRDGRHRAYVLWDADHGVRSFRQPASDLVARHAMTAESRIRAERSMTGLLGLLPFDDANAVPAGAQWVAVDAGPDSPVADARTYDLTWTDSGQTRRYRFYVEPHAKLPVRIERYVADAAKGAETMDLAQVITASNETEIQSLIYSVFGPYDPSIELPPTPPAFIGTPSDY